MKKSLQGRKGRPTIGKKRTFNCSDEDYALLHQASDKLGVKLSAFVRDASVEKAKAVLKGK